MVEKIVSLLPANAGGGGETPNPNFWVRVEKVDSRFQQMLEMGGRGAAAPAVEGGAPSPTCELGIISSSLPLGPETSKDPRWSSKTVSILVWWL